MTAPVVLQIMTSMKSIMGEYNNCEGTLTVIVHTYLISQDVCSTNVLSCYLI